MEDDIETMVEDIEKRSGKLDDWERDFIDSVSHQIGKGKALTIRQQDHVQKIWERVTE